jgi:transcriptional regulator with XRE-family HTH domain
MQQIGITLCDAKWIPRSDRIMQFDGARLRALRERKKYTLLDMAEKIGVSTQGYAKWENGSDPSIERLKQLCEILTCTADYLLGLTSEPYARVEEDKLPPDEKNLLKLYRSKKIPRHVKRLLGDLEIEDSHIEHPLIESESKSGTSGQ